MRSKNSRSRQSRKTKFETLEDRQMFSADPLANLLGGAVQQMGSLDPTTVQSAPLQAPPLQLHTALPIDPSTGQVPDFWQDPTAAVSGSQLENIVAESLASANAATGLTGVRQAYGLTGVGQTVAVIDTGIAYSHYALGGGLGANYRVVGGWDFAENDADPYDNGPAGGHGTHVSGIVGGNMNGSVTDSGVAPGVDLVALRVFDDNGSGYYSWVDSALQWVHNNRNSFANPITTVNLSLGTDWNANTIPSWATLESSLAQLEADGITITVSAGNEFTTYNSPGLSYPAASPHVIPVMSEDDNGTLSSFSQRSTNAIAAPGHYIVSTVPDYGGNHNGIDDDFASYSGTSMASPYVAGASVLVREVMQMTGQTNITEWTVYNQLMNTADSFVDSATGLTYKRLNLTNAIASLLPADDYGSTTTTASNLGTLSSDRTVTGLISSVSDADYFKYTAAVNGTVTITATAHYELSPTWAATGGTANGNTYTFQVTAGQTYNFGISTDEGIGTYDLAIHVAGSLSNTAPVLAAIGNKTVNEGSLLTFTATATDADLPANTLSYSLAAGAPAGASINASTGVFSWTPSESQGGSVYNLTVVVTDNGSPALSDSKSFSVTVNEVNTAPVLAAIGNKTVNEGSLLTFTATATDADLPANTLTYSLAAGAPAGASINASTGVFSWTPSAGQGGSVYNLTVVVTDNGSPALSNSKLFSVTVNRVDVIWGTIAQSQFSGVANTGATWYRVTAAQAGFLTAEASFTGASGPVTLAWYNANRQKVAAGTGTTDSQRAEITAVAGQQYYLVVTGNNADIDFRLTNLVAKNLTNVTVNGTSVADSFSFSADASQYTVSVNGTSYQFTASTVKAISFAGGGGNDSITMTGSAGNETAVLSVGNAQLVAANKYTTTANSIENIAIYGGGGTDSLSTYDSSGDDLFAADSTRSTMSGAGYQNAAFNFASVIAYTSTGNDQASIADSAGDDTYMAWTGRQLLTGAGYSLDIRGFDRTFARATTGNDVATFVDGAGDDVYAGWTTHAVMYGTGYFNDTTGFKSTIGVATTGNDQAFVYDSAGDDIYQGWSNRALLYGVGFSSDARGFDHTWAGASTGNDTATFFDTTGNDVFAAWSNHACMYGTGYFSDTAGFEHVIGIASTGNDQAFLYDSAGDDTYEAWTNRAVLNGAGFLNDAQGFDHTYAGASTGNDTATFHDSTGDDVFGAWSNHACMYGTGYFNDSSGFENVIGIATTGNDQAFFSDSAGDDTYEAWSNRATMSGTGYLNDARGFKRTVATGTTGNDHAILYDSAGNDSVHEMAWGAYMTGTNYTNEAHNFGLITADSSNGGTDTAFTAAVDYIFERVGNWV